jgi:glycosyltransferase involved in cell wall biosynthesis
MRVLIVTDSFPPHCGGSGWSTHELARGLRARGHELTIVQPRPGRRSGARIFEGLTIQELGATAPDLPYLRNYFKNERLWQQLQPQLHRMIRDAGIEIVHAQHVLGGPTAIAAAKTAGVPVVCTVRDYWPVCYWSTLIHDPGADSLCPACSRSMMTRCIRPRAGAFWPAALPFIPYMRRNLERKQHSLATADAVIAVSSTIACDLGVRASGLNGARIETIPNPVDLGRLRDLRSTTAAPLAAPYAIYVGKLEPNKGSLKLVAAIAQARLTMPLAIVGEGSERPRLERAFAGTGHDVRFTGWLDRDEAVRWLAHASMLVFPSHGPESLSRVLLEASALGVPIAAMDTGGTRDVVEHDVTGLLSSTPEQLGDHVSRLAADPALCARLAANARRRVETRFDAPLVVARIERLYRELCQPT